MASITKLTLSLVDNDVSRRELLMMMWYRRMMMPRTCCVMLNCHHLTSIHVHTITTKACCIFVLY